MMKTWNPVLPVCGLMLLVNACTKQGLVSPPNSDSTAVKDVTAASTASVSTHIEAEDYTAMSGVQVEDCREGGKDVGYISVGDWMDYTITVNTTGSHTLSFRVAGPKSTLQVQKPDGTVLANVVLPGTTSGQVYTTATATVQLSAGKQTIRIYANSAAWNFNWWEFTDASGGSVIKPDSTSTGQNLTLYSAFESTTDFAKWSEEICRPTALTISSEVPARKGKTSARFEFAKSDVTTYNGYVRAEIHQDSPPDAENWYGFSSFLPTDFVKDPMAEKIAQWHEIPDWDLGENWRSPPISLGIQNDRYTLQILWAAAPVNTNDTKDGEKDIDLGPVDKGKWNDFVFHIKFSYKSDGILEIWKNKVKIFSLYGPNSFNDENYPYFKVGIYKWTWNGWASYSPESKRVLYVDEVRIGNSKSNLNEVSPQ